MAPPKTLVFLDIDGTLLRDDYRPNSNAVPALIRKLSSKGYVFCLNSNRSFRDLLPVARAFGIRGPIIAENGVCMMESGKKYFFVDAPNIRDVLASALMTLSREQGAVVKYLDTVRYGREQKSSVKKTWLVNKFREYTASIHVRTHGKRDVKEAQKLAKQLRDILPGVYDISVSPIFANVLVSPKKADKGKAITALKKKHYRGARVIMIGDDAADLPTLKVVDAFCAVGNAERGIKKHAAFVAKKSHTQGVAEILRYIDSA